MIMLSYINVLASVRHISISTKNKVFKYLGDIVQMENASSRKITNSVIFLLSIFMSWLPWILYDLKVAQAISG